MSHIKPDFVGDIYRANVTLTGRDHNYCMYGNRYYFLEPRRYYGSGRYTYEMVYDFWSNEALNEDFQLSGIQIITSDPSLVIPRLDTVPRLTTSYNARHFINIEGSDADRSTVVLAPEQFESETKTLLYTSPLNVGSNLLQLFGWVPFESPQLKLYRQIKRALDGGELESYDIDSSRGNLENIKKVLKSSNTPRVVKSKGSKASSYYAKNKTPTNIPHVDLSGLKRIIPIDPKSGEVIEK